MSGNKSRGVTSHGRVLRLVFVAGCLVTMLILVPQSARAQITRNTVGPEGAFATIQDAISSCPNASECHVDVQMGQTYTENVVMEFFTGGKIVMTGGWDSTFTSREEGSRSSTIDGGGTGRVLDIQNGGTATIEIEGFIIENGSSTNGAGISVKPTGLSNVIVKLTNLDIRNNHASDTSECYGGGVYADIDGSERLEIVNCEIHQNSASGADYVFGGGIMISAYESTSFLVKDTWVEHNTGISDTGEIQGAGQAFYTDDDCSGEVVNVRVTNNTASGTGGSVFGTGGSMAPLGFSSLVVRRCVWALNENLTGSADGDQLTIFSHNASTLLITDSAVVLGDQDGLSASAYFGAQQQFVNLTVAENTGVGISVELSDAATASLYNSISYGNGTNASLAAAVDSEDNLIGVDPVWVAPGPPSYNYHLDQGSPALDAGNNAPPGGLGPLDLDGQPRVENSVVDIGCYEGAGQIFADGFESGGTGEWSTTVS